MSDKKHDIDRIDNAMNANNVALKYLVEQGIAVFGYEVTSIFKSGSGWFITIEGETFDGVVVINSKTGEPTSIKF